MMVLQLLRKTTRGFINDKGDKIIDFRNDLVLTKTDNVHYPVFHNNRCLISEKKDGILYYGYIDKTGKKVIEAKFLNASNFNNNVALALEVLSQTKGTNDILNKPVVYYKYFEVTIDTDGNIKEYLNPNGNNIALDKKFIKNPPKITSILISDKLVATLNENNKWVLKSIK